MGSKKSDLLIASDRMMYKTMTGFPAYENAMLHKSAGINVDTAEALRNRILAATAVQKAQESKAIGNKLVEGERRL